MKVILLKDVAKVGKKFDVKDVSDGFAFNFLIPQGKAKSATKDALEKVEALKALARDDMKVQEDLLAKSINEINEKVVEIEEKANDKGHLFAGLHKEQIAEILSSKIHSSISPDFIELEKPIKEVGEYTIVVKAHTHKAEVKLIITPAKK